MRLRTQTIIEHTTFVSKIQLKRNGSCEMFYHEADKVRNIADCESCEHPLLINVGLRDVYSRLLRG